MSIRKWAEKFVARVYCYKKVFNRQDPAVQAVLCDLARIAPVDPTTKITEPYDRNKIKLYMMIGRRQVVSHILGKINMTDEELSNLLKQEQIKATQENIM